MRSNGVPEQKSLFDSQDDRTGANSFLRARGGGIHSFNTIISRPRLYRAWQEFAAGKKYKKDVSEFSLRLDQNLRKLYSDLHTKQYKHHTYTHFVVIDPKARDIHKAVVEDRIVHHLLYSALYPYFDKKFIYDSYSCRLEKGTHRAMDRLQDFFRTVSKNNTKTCWVLKCDIKKFFASIDHGILKSILERHISDRDTLDLVSGIIDSFHTVEKPGSGLPLGNLTSQLLVNIYMNEFDQYMKHTSKVQYYIRYADDFVILADNKAYLEHKRIEIDLFLEEKLKLTLHPNKVFIKTYGSGVDFLGWVHFPHHRVLRRATKKRMMRKLGQTGQREKMSVIESYRGMLSHGDTYKVQKQLGFIQRS